MICGKCFKKVESLKDYKCLFRNERELKEQQFIREAYQKMKY